jgi:hypothetical protein
MGMFFNNDKKHYCGTYKGVKVWQYGCMIGNNWYGDFYITQEKNGRNYKVKDSVRRSWEDLKKYINEVWLKENNN